MQITFIGALNSHRSLELNKKYENWFITKKQQNKEISLSSLTRCYSEVAQNCHLMQLERIIIVSLSDFGGVHMWLLLSIKKGNFLSDTRTQALSHKSLK